MPHNSQVTDKLDTGRPYTARAATPPLTVPPRPEMPTVLVFHDVGSLVDSFQVPTSLDPNPPVRTIPDQGIVPTAAPPHHAGLNGGATAPSNGRPRNGVDRGNPVDLNGGGTGTMSPAPSGYVPVAPDHTPAPSGYAPVAPDHTPAPSGYAPVAPDHTPAPSGYAPVAPDHTPAPSGYKAATPDHAPSPVTHSPPLLNSPRTETTSVATVTDEDRSRYGVLLDHAAERGLLDSSEYEVRLRQLAEATTTEQMVAIVAELPALTPPVGAPVPRQSRSAIQSASRTAAGEGQRRRLIIWVLMGVLVALALVSAGHPGALCGAAVPQPQLDAATTPGGDPTG